MTTRIRPLSLCLKHPRLNILACKNRVVVNSALLKSDMALGVSIKFLSLACVQVNRIRPRNGVEDERNAHGFAGPDVVRDVAEDNGTDGTTADGSNEEGGTALGVATQTAESECEDWTCMLVLEAEQGVGGGGMNLLMGKMQDSKKSTIMSMLRPPQLARTPSPVSVPMAAAMKIMMKVWKTRST
jgi:hypothetical protein